MRFIFVYLIVVLGVLSVSSAWKPATGAMKKSFASAALGISILTGAALPSLADGIPSVGQLAPDFTLPSNTGKDISLNDLKDNKFTVIYFYPGDFTSGCTIEAKAFERDFSKYQELGSQILGISVDSVDKHLDFGKKYGLEFPLASDQGGKVSNKYGSLLDIPFMGKFSNRQTYIVDNKGVVRYVFTDVESKLASHSGDVLAKIKELSAQ
jgi:thioredoxin-dependent peroxiredoxin